MYGFVDRKFYGVLVFEGTLGFESLDGFLDVDGGRRDDFASFYLQLAVRGGPLPHDDGEEVYRVERKDFELGQRMVVEGPCIGWAGGDICQIILNRNIRESGVEFHLFMLIGFVMYSGRSDS